MKKAPLLLLLAIVCMHPAWSQPHNNPVLTGADPHAMMIGKEYWVYPTNAVDTGAYKRADRFYAYASADLQQWTNRGELITMNDISWIKDDGAANHSLWAPGMLHYKKKYYLYYSVGPQNPTPSRIGVAVSAIPNGGFKDAGKPLLTGGNGFEAIDPMVFIDHKTKNAYLYAGGSAGATLRVFLLKKRLTEIDHEVTITQPPLFTEGVFMHERDGVYYLSYSHGSWNNSSYSVHYATATSPTGPWDYKGVLLSSDSTHKGPGHHSFVFNAATKKWYIVYHRWERNVEGTYRGTRKVAIEPISYDGNGLIMPVQMTDSISAF